MRLVSGLALGLALVGAVSPATAQPANKGSIRAASKASAVFYAGEGTAGIKEAKPYAAYTLSEGSWTGHGRCDTSSAIPDTNGRPITTLAGHSLGRLGPVYYLKRASKARRDRVRYVFLSDPGSFATLVDSCDTDRRIDADGVLASWLASNPTRNRLIIMGGADSFDLGGGALFNGLRSIYFRKFVSAGVGGQVLVCNAEKGGVPYSHGDVIKTFANLIDDADAPSTCPLGLYGWRPGQKPYANTIVQWNADPSPQRTAWLVGEDGKRRWIPDVGTFGCLQQRVGGPRRLAARILDLLPDQRGVHATCASVPAGPPQQGPPESQSPPAGGAPSVSLAQGPAAPAGYRYAITLSGFAPGTAVQISCHDSVDPGGFYSFTLTTDGAGNASTASYCYSGDGPDHWVVAGGIQSNHVSWGGGSAPPQPPAPAPTWREQQGSLGANTFTNPNNASGLGVKIQPYQWVDVSCKVYAPQIASANPDGYWYRIASPPWSNAYYAVANTFWNGDVPGQRPYTHNTDWAVPNC